jgi:hypothetical protein
VAVIETMTFALRAGTDDATFLAVDRRVQTGFAYQQPGLVRRTTARGAEGQWIVVDLWSSASDADAMGTRWETDALAAEFMACVDAETVQVRRYTTLD